ncbi:hypothetical protein V8Z69_14780 [Microbacterium aurugineum]|uniref:hypothetical protein n=1 Tax=Microbacterium TaxID=33882 RepID=UPI001E39194E|nr:hypothetical protein [Microbacterium sp. KKR3/1]MCE0509597.1 hypothetical protein [Microbacterium sp. KKR3/1]
MKWLFRFIGSLVAALVATVGAAVVTAIWLMFSAGSSEGQRLGFFGAVFVDVRQTPRDTIELGVGLADPIPLVLSVGVITVLLVAVMVVHDQLRERKRQLLAEAE